MCIQQIQTKKNIYWQPNTSWVYIVWKSENIVYINGTKIDLSKNKQYDERDNIGESFYSKKTTIHYIFPF